MEKEKKNLAKKSIVNISSLFFICLLFLLFKEAGADGWDPGSLKVTGLTDRSLFSILTSVVNWAITFIGILAVIIFIYGGFIYLTSQGESDKIEQAKKIILYAVVGVIVSILGFVAVSTIDSIVSGRGVNTGSPNQDSSPGGGNDSATPQDPVNMNDPASGYQRPYSPGAGGGGALPVSPDMVQ